MERTKSKIILIGYRATGKTSAGRALAERLGFDFIDTDHEIEKKQGQTIQEMVSKYGWDYFRRVEKEYLLTLCGRGNLVVAPGGGAILHGEIWRELKEVSLVVWLRADVETICRRLGRDACSASQRPALTDSTMLAEVEAVLGERTPLYDRGSHYTVDATKPLAEVVDEIGRLWSSFGKN